MFSTTDLLRFATTAVFIIAIFSNSEAANVEITPGETPKFGDLFTDSYHAKCQASELLADRPVRGLHPFCVQLRDDVSLDFIVFFNSQNASSPTSFSISANSHNQVRTALERKFGFKTRTVNSWAFYSPLGDNIDSFTHLATTDVFTGLIIEGGSFIWPGVRIGFKRVVFVPTPSANGDSFTMETISMDPLIFGIENFLTLREVEYIQGRATPHMTQSSVSKMDKDVAKPVSEWRTSESYFMETRSHPPLKSIDERVASLTKTPRQNQGIISLPVFHQESPI